MKKRNDGFTLAEVLITLVIIGVTGALTVPALIQNTQKQEYVSALKKAYSTLASATNMIITEEGSFAGMADYGNGNVNSLVNGGAFAAELFSKYLNVSKKCIKKAAECIPQLNSGGFENLRSNYPDPNTLQNLKGGSALVLADGVQLNFGFYNNSCSSEQVCTIIVVDVNGTKGPNKLGRDVFYFNVTADKLIPSGCGEIPQGYVSVMGKWCACKVLTEGAMNY